MTSLLGACLVPSQTSLSRLKCARKGRREGAVPFPWSLAVQHQSLEFRARLYDAKNEAPEEEAGWELFSKAKDSGISQNEDFQASCMERTGLTNK